MYYPCSENKGADQLRNNCEADLRLCFPLCRLLVFPCGGSNIIRHIFVRSGFNPDRKCQQMDENRTGLQTWRFNYFTTTTVVSWHEITNNLGFRPSPKQTGMYNLRSRLKTGNFKCRKNNNCTIRVAKTKALISFLQS